MPAIKHTHTYKRYTKKYYMCAHPECTHLLPKKMLVGKLSCCNKCGKEFKLTSDDLRRAYPVCLNCSNTKAAKKHQQIRELTEKIFV